MEKQAEREGNGMIEVKQIEVVINGEEVEKSAHVMLKLHGVIKSMMLECGKLSGQPEERSKEAAETAERALAVGAAVCLHLAQLYKEDASCPN